MATRRKKIGDAILSAMQVGTDAWQMQQEMRLKKLEEDKLRATIAGWEQVARSQMTPFPSGGSPSQQVRQPPAVTPPSGRLRLDTSPRQWPSSSSRTTGDILRKDPALSPLQMSPPEATSVDAQPQSLSRPQLRSGVTQRMPPPPEMTGRGVNQEYRDTMANLYALTQGEFNAPGVVNMVLGPHKPGASDRSVLRGEAAQDAFYAAILNPTIETREEIDPITGQPVTVTGPDWSFDPNIRQEDVVAAYAFAGKPNPFDDPQQPSPVDQPHMPQKLPQPNPSTFGLDPYSVTQDVSGNKIEQPDAPQSDAEWIMATTQKIADAQSDLLRGPGMFGSRMNERGQTITPQPLSAERQREVETLSGIAGSLREAARLSLTLNNHQGTAAILQGLWQKGQKYTGTNQDAIKLDQIREVLAATMARLVGETGRFTEGDVSRGKALIPDLMMSQENTIWLINYASALLNEKLVGFSRPMDPAILSGQGLPFIEGGRDFEPFTPPSSPMPNNGAQNGSLQIIVPK